MSIAYYRGRDARRRPQGDAMFSYVSAEQRVSQDHRYGFAASSTRCCLSFACHSSRGEHIASFGFVRRRASYQPTRRACVARSACRPRVRRRPSTKLRAPRACRGALHAGNRLALAVLAPTRRVDGQFDGLERRVLPASLIRCVTRITWTERAAEASLRPISRFAVSGVCAGGRGPAHRRATVRAFQTSTDFELD